jgi:hypothetical protein
MRERFFGWSVDDVALGGEAGLVAGAF